MNRIKNPKLVEYIRTLPCEACGTEQNIQCHHMISGGKGRKCDEIPDLLMPLCFKHHRELHDEGLKHMVNKYGLDLLIRNFEFCEIRDKWFYSNN